MHRRVVALMSALALIVAIPSSALALGTLDQHQDGTAFGGSSAYSQNLAQTFTAGITGNLDGVSITVGSLPQQLSHDANIAIADVSGNAPTNLHWTNKTVTLHAGENTVEFTDNQPEVVAGTQYAIVVDPVSQVTLLGTCDNSYAGGRALIDDGGTWKTVPGYYSDHAGETPLPEALTCGTDWAFKTYVTAVPQAKLGIALQVTPANPPAGYVTPFTGVVTVTNTGEAVTDGHVFLYLGGHEPTIEGTATETCTPPGGPCAHTYGDIDLGVIDVGGSVTVTVTGLSFDGTDETAGAAYDMAATACIDDLLTPTKARPNLPLPAGCVQDSVPVTFSAAAPHLALDFSVTPHDPVVGTTTPFTLQISVTNDGSATTGDDVYIYAEGQLGPVSGSPTATCIPTGACNEGGGEMDFGVIDVEDTVTWRMTGVSFNGVGRVSGDSYPLTMIACIGPALTPNKVTPHQNLPPGCVEATVDIVYRAAAATPTPTPTATPTRHVTAPPTVLADEPPSSGASGILVVLGGILVFGIGLLLAGVRTRRRI